MSELSNEERLQLRIRELENELKTAKSVLLHTSAQLIEERRNHAKTREYANTHQQENALLKERIEELLSLSYFILILFIITIII